MGLEGVKLYIDGTEHDEGYTTWSESSKTEIRLFIYVGGGPGGWLWSLDGKIDEVQFSNVARSDSWISTSYNSQNDPSSFFSVGPEESGP